MRSSKTSAVVKKKPAKKVARKTKKIVRKDSKITNKQGVTDSKTGVTNNKRVTDSKTANKQGKKSKTGSDVDKKITRKDSKTTNKKHAKGKTMIDDIHDCETNYQSWVKLNSILHSTITTDTSTKPPPSEFVSFNVFNNKTTVPSSLVKLLDLEKGAKLTRHQLVDHLYAYFQVHELVDSKTNNIIPNKPLSKAFDLRSDEYITFYDLQPRLNKLCSGDK